MTENQEHDQKQALLHRLRTEASDLGAFDAVLIIATWCTEAGSTAAVHSADGNWYAQNGLADYFLTKRRQEAILEQIDQHNDRDP